MQSVNESVYKIDQCGCFCVCTARCHDDCEVNEIRVVFCAICLSFLCFVATEFHNSTNFWESKQIFVHIKVNTEHRCGSRILVRGPDHKINQGGALENRIPLCPVPRINCPTFLSQIRWENSGSSLQNVPVCIDVPAPQTLFQIEPNCLYRITQTSTRSQVSEKFSCVALWTIFCTKDVLFRRNHVRSSRDCFPKVYKSVHQSIACF